MALNGVTHNVFVYGSLLAVADEVVQLLLNRLPSSSPAILANFFVPSLFIFLELFVYFLIMFFLIIITMIIEFLVNVRFLFWVWSNGFSCELGFHGKSNFVLKL
ncbi:hypothetical protein RND81_13G062000 [Saponaria officinalis]|uniref:Uncharacterized protein n=1 Tax=Saponaria officinalis TaxID=3572 RepID=A0AAW1H0Y9_SAPOF